MQSANDTDGAQPVSDGRRQAKEDISKYRHLNVEQLEQELQRIQDRGLELTAQMRECNDPKRVTALQLEALNWMLRAQVADAEISNRRLDALKKERKQQKKIRKEAREQAQREERLKEEEMSTQDQAGRSGNFGHEQETLESDGADTVEKTMEYYITQEEPPEEGGNASMAPPEQLPVPLYPQQDHDATKIQTEISKSQSMQSGGQSLQHLTGDSGNLGQEKMEGLSADMEDSRKMEHHTTPEEPQVVAEELGASPATEMQDSTYPQKPYQQIPRPHSLLSTSLEPQLVVDGSAASSQTSGNGEANGSNDLLRSEWNYDHLSQEFAMIGKGTASPDHPSLGADDRDKIGTATFIAENGDHGHPRHTTLDGRKRIPYRARRFRDKPEVVLRPFAARVHAPRRYAHRHASEQIRPTIIDNERQTHDGHDERSLLDHITDKLEEGKHWIGKKLQIAAEGMLLSSADYDHRLVHDNPRLQEPEAQADVPSPVSLNTEPGPAGLLQDSQETASSNGDQSLLLSGHFRRCVESPGCENPSAHLKASEEQSQVSTLQFLVINTSLVGLSECGNIEP
jgi:hypothetical protein